MKKILKFLLWTIIALVVIIASVLGFFAVRGIPEYEPVVYDFKVKPDSALTARGKRMAYAMCVECHRNDEGNSLTGKELRDIPLEFGTIYSANITRDPEHGIGKWTDGQLISFLRTGIKPNGAYAPAYMPKFLHMSDADLHSIISWLRSDDPLLKANSTPTQAPKITFLTKLLCNTVMKPLPFPEKGVAEPDTNNAVEYGKYIVTGRFPCYQCHSKDFKTNNDLEPEKSEGYMGGGNAMLTMEREVINTANITMDKETGIGNWTYEQFKTVLTQGKYPDRIAIRYPMMPHTFLSEREVASIYAYLQSLPPIKNKVDRKL